MKTAISIPDGLFERADEVAEELGVSRSELYSRAVNEFLARRGDEDVRRRLDEVYSKVEARLDPVLEELQRGSLTDEDW